MKYRMLKILNAIRCLKYIKAKNIHIGINNYMHIKSNLEIDKNVYEVNIGEEISTNNNCRIAVRSGATMTIGNNVTFNTGCQVISRKKVNIGNNCHFGCNVIIIDNDHCFNAERGYTPGFITDEIKIGDNCLIGANTVILKGVAVGDNCLIGAGSVITKDIPSGSKILQKREIIVL